MSTRALRVIAFGSFGSLVAFGGRASSLDVAAAPCEPGVDCAEQVPEAELPETVTILELRQVSASPPLAENTSCEYESRIKVNLEERLMIYNTCSADASGSNVTYSSNFTLTAGDISVIQSAYAELTLSDVEQCTSGPELMTLDVSTDARPGPELLLADDDHSGCALPHLEQHDFVAGLDELRSVLLSLRAP